MKREELKSYLPHREPMLLVDEVDIVSEGVCRGSYRIREDEHFCQGHFPNNPIVPGIVLCEIMAQCCSILVLDDLVHNVPIYAGIRNVRFKQTVRPGDLCEVEARLVARRGAAVFCDAELKVDGKVCCCGELSFVLVAK